MLAMVIAILVAISLYANQASAQPLSSKPLWGSVQKICDRTAATTPGALASKIAQTALDEHYRFGGHQIDSDGRLFRFGLVESEQEEDDGNNGEARLGRSRLVAGAEVLAEPARQQSEGGGAFEGLGLRGGVGVAQ